MAEFDAKARARELLVALGVEDDMKDKNLTDATSILLAAYDAGVEKGAVVTDGYVGCDQISRRIRAAKRSGG